MYCVHCDPKSYELSFPLLKGKYFTIYADSHPLTEGHILLITNKHVSCMGSLAKEFGEFRRLYKIITDFLSKEYGSFAVFEHGIAGQTVFHAHMHFLPFEGSLGDIIPERDSIERIKSIDDIRTLFLKNGKYLFLQINKNFFSVNTKIGKPKFFRDRFAKALGRPERGDWKGMDKNRELMKKSLNEIEKLKGEWKQ
jgi:diadenosine tetraphosphate (Ap4A) HIT family hydrolase